MIVLAALGLFQGLRDEFVTDDDLRGDLTLNLSVFDEWWLWIILALAITLLFVLEGAYRLVSGEGGAYRRVSGADAASELAQVVMLLSEKQHQADARFARLESRIAVLEGGPLPAREVVPLVSQPVNFDLGEYVQAAVGWSDGVLENLVVRVERSWEEPASVRIVKNGQPSTFEVPLTGTGLFQDMSNAVMVVSGDELRCELVVAERVLESADFLIP